MIGVVGHDAGAMEIITSYVRRQQLNCSFCVEGAATAVVTRKLGGVPISSLDEIINRCDWLLCGTSFLSDLEWRAIGLARLASKRCVVVLDHWVNYRQRFMRHGELRLPDEIWVGDEIAARIASEELPEVRQSLVPNAYFMDILDEVQSFDISQRIASDALNILYVCEPLRDDGLALYGDERYWGYTEEEALSYFLSHVGLLSDNINRIVIRSHPQEPLEKYRWAEREFDLPIVFEKNRTLIEQVVASDVIVGCATMAMVVGLLANKRVMSCIPPEGKTIPLPQREIVDMSRLIEAQQEKY